NQNETSSINKNKTNSNDFIDNLKQTTKNNSKANFELSDNKFFSSNLSRILEESNSEKSELNSEMTFSSIKL
ncbi:unnamed protein product, partial [Brachionus calyciflorus]